jgi:Transcriptional regulator/sugar kinase
MYKHGGDIVYYGLDVGGTKIEFAAFDKDVNKVISERIPTPIYDYSLLVKSIVELINKHDDILGCTGSIGIGIPGAERATDKSVITANIPCANKRSLRNDIEISLGRPITLENDANCFALSEAWAGNKPSHSTILGLILGTGFGAGIINNGRIVSGKNNMAGELGHMRLPLDAWLFLKDNLTAEMFDCGCGKTGCLDNYLSGRGFELLYQSHFGIRESATEIADKYDRNDKNCVYFVDFYIEFLAICLGNIFTAIDPHTVYLGGGLSKFDALYTKLPPLINKYMMPNAEGPTINKANFGDSGGVRGAALLNI